jgi:hypothetical protein
MKVLTMYNLTYNSKMGEKHFNLPEKNDSKLKIKLIILDLRSRFLALFFMKRN